MTGPSGSQDFAERLRPHGVALLRYLRRVLYCPEDAEEVLQDALVRALRAYPRFDAASSFREWIFRVATNEARTANRRRRRGTTAAPVPADVESHEADVDAELAYERILEAPDRILARLDEPVSRAIGELRDQERTAFLLHAIADLSCSEIARTLEAPKGTVFSWLFRARAHLRRRLADYARALGWKAARP